MLKKFEVSNYKGFKDNLVFDLTSRDYNYNKHLVKNGIVNKAIIYGKNGTGKSSLGLALFDITWHLTDKEKMKPNYYMNYINMDSGEEYATFRYHFQFGNTSLVYEYQKKDINNLICEKLTLDDVLILSYNYFDSAENFISSEVFGELNINLIDNKLSVLKYIYRSLPTNRIPSSIIKMMEFCENMLWYRSLSEGNQYCGFTNGSSLLSEKLYESGKYKEFEDFLRKNDLDYKLSFQNINGAHELFANFKDKKSVPFASIASTGTMALYLFFVWSIYFNKISFLFIDEFDAFFHYESAENIILLLNDADQFQTVVTSHNTYLMQNKLTRPDCCFIMTSSKITSLSNSTKKELREAHNLEKIYVNGGFNE